MDMSNSEYNSASESGWTNYLNQSSFSETHFNRRGSRIVDYEGNGARMEEEKEEEDLSMISDASSGPPHYNNIEEDDQPYFLHTKESKKKVKEYGRNHQQNSPLDDTASSPVLNYPKKKGVVESTIEFSPSFSATRIIKRKPKFQKHSFGVKQATEELGGGFNEEGRK